MTALPVTIIEPSGEKSQPAIACRLGSDAHCASGASKRRRSHSLSEPSVDLEASCCPSRCQRTQLMSHSAACAVRHTLCAFTLSADHSTFGVAFLSSTTGWKSARERISHSCSEPSLAPHMIVCPPSCHAIDDAPLLIPRASRRTMTVRRPDWTERELASSPRSHATLASHKRTVPSSEAVASVFASVGCHLAAVQPATCPLVLVMSRRYGSPLISCVSLRPSRS